MSRELKVAKKPRDVRNEPEFSVSNILDGLLDTTPAPIDINTATKLTKALKIGVDTKNSNRLLHTLINSIGLQEIPDYVAFVLAEWGSLRVYAPYNDNRGSGASAPYSLSSLCTHHSTIKSLYALYTADHPAYLGRLGDLDKWEVDRAHDSKDSSAEILELKSYLGKANKEVQILTAKLEDSLKVRDGLAQAYKRSRRFAMFFQQYIPSGVSADNMLDYLETGTVPDTVPKHLSYLFD